MKSFPSHAPARTQRCEEQCEAERGLLDSSFHATARAEAERGPLVSNKVETWRSHFKPTARTQRCDEQCEVERGLLDSSGGIAFGGAGAITL